jgi:hypothetical protein
MVTGGGLQVEIVRGRLSPERTTDLLRFWSSLGVVDGNDALRRLPDVAALLVDRAGIVVGSCSVRADAVPLIGGRWLWRYDHAIEREVRDEHRDELFNAAFAVLDGEHEPGGQGPIGICVAVDDPVVLQRRDAIWSGTELVYAGYDAGDRQVRVRYFAGAEVHADPLPDRLREFPDDLEAMFPFPAGYRIHDRGEGPSAEEIVALWREEGLLSDDEARRRLDEIVGVATAPDGTLAGVATAFLTRVEQLRLDLWATRALVADAHRRSNLATHLYLRATDVLRSSYASGVDQRGHGMLVELENEGVQRMIPLAEWPFAPSRYVGDRTGGVPRYVEWFDGAQVPLP